MEVTALVVIGGAAAIGGRETLARLHEHYLPVATVVLIGLIAVAAWTLMKIVRENRAGARLSVSKRVAYLAALILGLWAVVAPARWVIGGSVAALEIALAFDVVSALAAEPRAQ